VNAQPSTTKVIAPSVCPGFSITRACNDPCATVSPSFTLRVTPSIFSVSFVLATTSMPGCAASRSFTPPT
jgi:hypothetical protein